MTRIYDFLGPDGFGPHEVDLAGGTARRVTQQAEALLIPGFVDIHIHGGFGIDFMSAQKSDMERLCGHLADEGYEYFLPTTVSASPADVTRALSAIPESPMIPGFHLEGPFISPKYPGAQPPTAIVLPPDGPSEWDPILNDPRLKVVTMAPEMPGALAFASRLRERNVSASMGHTNATYAEAQKGHEAGVVHATHTFNAMRPLHHREAGAVGFALGADSLYTELIYDRLHVCKEAAAVLLKCKPADKLIAVSDGTMAGGQPAGTRLQMWGLSCVVGEKQVRLEDGTLAGSGITLLDAFRNLAADFGLPTAIRACSLNPRHALGLPKPRVYIEMDRDLAIIGRHSASA